MKVRMYYALFLFLFLFACGKQDNTESGGTTDDFASLMADRAYLGSAKSTLYLHGYEAFPSVEGKGSFNMGSVSGDSVTLALICELSSGDGFEFGIPGKQVGKEWSASFGKGSFSIQENGVMSGKMETDVQEISWDGQLFDDRVMLDIRLKYLKQEGSITEGSIIATHLDLSRAGEGGNTGTNGCRNIVWETRSVFNLYSGGVDIIRVPVCHN